MAYWGLVNTNGQYIIRSIYSMAIIQLFETLMTFSNDMTIMCCCYSVLLSMTNLTIPIDLYYWWRMQWPMMTGYLLLFDIDNWYYCEARPSIVIPYWWPIKCGNDMMCCHIIYCAIWPWRYYPTYYWRLLYYSIVISNGVWQYLWYSVLVMQNNY